MGRGTESRAALMGVEIKKNSSQETNLRHATVANSAIRVVPVKVGTWVLREALVVQNYFG